MRFSIVATDDEDETYANYWIIPLKGVSLSLSLPSPPSLPVASVGKGDQPEIGFGMQRKGNFTFVKEDVFPFVYGDVSRISGENIILVRFFFLFRLYINIFFRYLDASSIHCSQITNFPHSFH